MSFHVYILSLTTCSYVAVFFFYHPRPWVIMFCEYFSPGQWREMLCDDFSIARLCIIYIPFVKERDLAESWSLVKGRIQAAIIFRPCPRSIVTKLSKGFQLRLFYLEGSHIAWLHFSKISCLFCLKRFRPLGVEWKWRNREVWKEVRKMYRVSL